MIGMAAAAIGLHANFFEFEVLGVNFFMFADPVRRCRDLERGFWVYVLKAIGRFGIPFVSAKRGEVCRNFNCSLVVIERCVFAEVVF